MISPLSKFDHFRAPRSKQSTKIISRNRVARKAPQAKNALDVRMFWDVTCAPQ
jgi:hypothetical protein